MKKEKVKVKAPGKGGKVSSKDTDEEEEEWDEFWSKLLGISQVIKTIIPFAGLLNNWLILIYVKMLSKLIAVNY